MRAMILCCALLLAMRLGAAYAGTGSSGSGRNTLASCALTAAPVEQPPAEEPAALGGGLVFDEHVLIHGSADQDYDGGGEVTLSGQRGGVLGRSLDKALDFMDEKICAPGRDNDSDWSVAHAFAAGLLVFTPSELAARGVVRGDRPYASLFFLSAGRRYTSPGADVAYDSSLTVGMLGLAAAEAVQSGIHRLIGSAHPNGWSHQISAGGEPTARYSVARQALLADFGRDSWRGESKWTAATSVGTVTEASLSLSARWGRLEAPWSSFAPEENMYVQETQPVPPQVPVEAPSEIFLFAGIRGKVRVYNAFLQGQFRHSDLTYDEGELNQLLGEAWGGVELRTSSGWSVQYLVRWESPELRSGIGSRSIMWGSIEISKALR